MKKRSLRNGAVMVIALGALTGVGTMVASASTRPSTTTVANGGAPAGSQAGQRGSTTAGQPGSTTDGPLDPSTTAPSDDRSAATGDLNACVPVQATDAQQNGDARLCTTVERTGQRVGQVRVSLSVPAGECRDGVTLGVTTQQAGAARTQFAACTGTDGATATFALGQEVATGSQVCGILADDDRFTAAQACVRIAA